MLKRCRRSVPVALLCCALVAFSQLGCSGAEQSAIADAPDQSEKQVVNEQQPGSSAGDGWDIDGQVQFAREDLAAQLQVSQDQVTVHSVRQVQWRSGALGCPKPGMNYTMALVPGLLILVEAEGRTYRYHGGRTGQPRQCAAERAEAPATGQGEQAW